VIWVFAAFSFLLLLGRLYTRWTTFRRFFWDDFVVLLAWSLSLAITASTTALNERTYTVMYIIAGLLKAPCNICPVYL
jgi:hypothetical protein